MEWQEVLEALNQQNAGYPEAVVEAVMADPALLEQIFQEFERVSHDSRAMQETLFVLHALHILAACRDTRALPGMLRIMALPSDELECVLGDLLTESMSCCIASVAEDCETIKAFIENPAYDMWARYIMVDVLAVRVCEGDLDAAEVLPWAESYAETLVRQVKALAAAGAISDEESALWDVSNLLIQGFADLLADIGGPAQLVTLQRWWAEKQLDPMHAGIDFYEREVLRPLSSRCADRLANGGGYVRDVACHLRGWPCFETLEEQAARRSRFLSSAVQQPVVKPPKVGRNDPCPCGSGKKFKKCCGAH